jgi:hypothetical protein
MARNRSEDDAPAAVQDMLGYLNFAAGASDPRFLKNINELFSWTAPARTAETPTWRALGQSLRDELQRLRGAAEAFRGSEQAEAAISLVFDGVLPAYRQFHGDLLFHQTDEDLFQPLFIGRACEAVLQQGGPWGERDRIVTAAVRQLNDFIGHRPVATLRTEQKIQPYEHEWVAPIPLWIRGAGAAAGPYRELVETALAILDATDPALLFDAMLALEQLEELSFDPRAYDFDHPVNKRPNYLFGQWDMHRLDNAGRCRRFVLQQAALDAMLDRLEHHGRLSRKQVLFEEAAVLAGTMMMGSGVSGNRPDAHDSTVTLARLVQKIANYRDVFYEQLLGRLQGGHAERLRAEAAALRQPFGGARQHFNHFLARRRAEQLQHVHVAHLFAAIGSPESAARHADVVPVASARITCQMRCRLAAGHLAIERGKLAEAARQLPPVEDLLHRGIECGAIVDPWNVLGFDAQYSLFPAAENSVHDHRVDQLLEVISDIFLLYVRLGRAAAAAGETQLQEKLLEDLGALARWWDQFATVEVSSVEGISGQATLESAESVGAAIRAWHDAGAAAGDLAFWRKHVEHFRVAKACALVIDTLLDRRDFVSAMAVLVQWLSRAEEIPLVEEDYSFHDLALGWMEEVWRSDRPDRRNRPAGNDLPAAAAEERPAGKSPPAARAKRGAKPPDAEPAVGPPPQRWAWSRKFLDYLESNAEEYWQVPRFEMAAEILGADDRRPPPRGEEPERRPGGESGAEEAAGPLAGDFDEDASPPEADGLFDAAYEGVSYRDSADDGIEGEMFETGGSPTDFELVGEAQRIVNRLNFLTTVAQLWKLAAMASMAEADAGRDETLAVWLDQARQNHRKLLELMATVHRHRIPPPRGTQESLIEFDRRRSVKDTLLEEIIQACVETADAARMIRASMARPATAPERPPWERLSDELIAQLIRGDASGVRRRWPGLLSALKGQPLLYVALSRGGNPRRIAASRDLQNVIRRLLSLLPKLGLLTETCQLLETAQVMEVSHPQGPGAITEFDLIFETACAAITRCLAVSADAWQGPRGEASRGKASRGEADAALVDCLESLTEVMLHCWLTHSGGVRLSVLETVAGEQPFRELRQFVERYGADLFSQHFMSFGNLRGILHQGVREYLEMLHEEPGPEGDFRLLGDLGRAISWDEAAHWLGVAIEAVVENYGEYVDYNSITTQSDRGDMLYTLLDFLRLRAGYDRVAWNLQPVLLVHQTLVRCGKQRAATMWRRAVARRTAATADESLKRFNKLCRKYGMRLPSVADRLAERFVRPLEIDRLCASIGPAVREVRHGRRRAAVERLEKQIDRFTAEPPGAGFELPGWLAALDAELDQLDWESGGADEETEEPELRIAQVRLSRREVQRQINQLTATERFWPGDEA